jgi:sugar phosphate isomerase/epimerase
MNAGLDPVTTMEKYKERIRFIHLKDGIPKNPSAPESKPIGKSVGLGVLPAKEVIAKAGELGITMIVESEDLDPNGLAEVKRCIDFLKSL